MGSYFTQVFKRAGHKVIIADKGTKLTNEQLAQKADVVIISVPIHRTREVIRSIVKHVRKEAVLLDLTSLKQFPLKEMLKAKSDVIGLHPMFGPTNPLEGQTVITCPGRGKRWYTWLKSLLKAQGAIITELTPKEHDKIMGIVQGMVHFADIAFGHALKELKIPIKKFIRFAGPASELKIAFSARLLAQDPQLYASIELENPEALRAIKQYAKSIQKLMKIDEKNDLKSFVEYFNGASKSLENYEKKAFDDTNYLIHAILERRKRQKEIELLGKKKTKAPQNNIEVAVLGPENTFSDLAAQKYLKKEKNSGKIGYFASVPDVFDAVTNGLAKKGIVPLENILQGSIRETFDELHGRAVHIISKFHIPIHHSLVALPGVKKKDINTIASHAQALNQCSNHLRKLFPHARRVGSPSTFAAYVSIVGENDRHTAVIIPDEIAQGLGGNILSSRIENNKGNQTTFVVIKKGKARLLTKSDTKKKYETSLSFSFGEDRPGALFSIFKIFADANINLSRIESRPCKENIGKYIFFLDFEGSPGDPITKKVLSEMKKKVAAFKLLGVY